MERGPIFVAGLERSGTSLLYALLASHPNIAMTRRTNLWTHFYGQYGDLEDDGNLDRCLATMMRYKRLRVLDPDVVRLRRDFVGGPRHDARLFALLEEQYAQRVGRPRWGDKSLHTERWAVPILGSYPGSRILHMIRDPRDRFASSRARWRLRRGGVGVGAAEWVRSARLAIRNQAAHPDRYRVVRYEDLVTHPDEELRALCEFVDEPYDVSMLTMTGAPRLLAQGGNSSYGPREPGVISRGSIGRYRSVLSSREIVFVERAARDEMAYLGYEPDGASLRARDGLRYVVSLPVEGLRACAWRVREARHDRGGRPVPSYRLVDEVAPT